MEIILYILVAYYIIQLEKSLSRYFIERYQKFKKFNKQLKNKKRNPEQIQAEVFNLTKLR